MATVLRKFARHGFAWFALLGSAAASYVAVSAWQDGRATRLAAVNATAQSTIAPLNPFASANGTHLIAFVIAASDCGWSTRPGTMKAIGELRETMQLAYRDSFAQVSVIGVALDEDLETGLSFLKDIEIGRAHV